MEDFIDIFRECSALFEGHFELRSGLHSDQFFQCANVLRYPEVAGKLCKELVMSAKTSLVNLEVDGVVSPALGGILVGHEIARILNLPSIFVEKKEGDLVLRRFSIRRGDQFIVAEDVVTRGGRVQETIDIVHQFGGNVVCVLVLVDRSGGGLDFGCPHYSLVDLSPEIYQPATCPLCKNGCPLVHPGS